jgi:membrane associated rhomboid family serine protease
MAVFLVWVLDRVLSLVLLLPLKDERGRYRSFPYMTLGLVGLNTAVYVFVHGWLPQWVGDEDAWRGLVLQMMLVPADLLRGEGLGALTVVTSAFLHANWSHLVGNMFFLFFFGRKLEDVLGPAKLGLFYLVCAFMAAIGSVLGRAALPVTQGTLPSLGASGAIMGVVAAYLFLYHAQRIRTLMVLVFIPIPVALRMPAWAFILYTVMRDVIRGWLEQQFQAYGYLYSLVGSFAHLGGVIAGLTCIYFFLPSELIHYRHRPGIAP